MLKTQVGALTQNRRPCRLQNRCWETGRESLFKLSQGQLSVYWFMVLLVTRARKFLYFIAVCIDECVEAGMREDCRELKNEMRRRQKAYTHSIFNKYNSEDTERDLSIAGRDRGNKRMIYLLVVCFLKRPEHDYFPTQGKGTVLRCGRQRERSACKEPLGMKQELADCTLTDTIEMYIPQSTIVAGYHCKFHIIT